MIKLFVWLGVFLICGINCKNSSSEKLMIATAANMQFAMEELVLEFSTQTQIDCEIVVSSSGKLTAQIKAGAPYDIFVSADNKFPNELFESGLTIAPPQVYAVGKLVVWSTIHSLKKDLNFTSPNFQKIAIANPKTAPYGKAAMEWLEKNNSFESLKNKLVFGESISQVNQFVFSKVADIGFTSKSVVLSNKMKTEGNWIELNPEYYSPIQQGIVLLNNSNSKIIEAKEFQKFLLSDQGKLILHDYGYGGQHKNTH